MEGFVQVPLKEYDNLKEEIRIYKAGEMFVIDLLSNYNTVVSYQEPNGVILTLKNKIDNQQGVISDLEKTVSTTEECKLKEVLELESRITKLEMDDLLFKSYKEAVEKFCSLLSDEDMSYGWCFQEISRLKLEEKDYNEFLEKDIERITKPWYKFW